MSIEGQLTIRLQRGQVVPARVQIASTRPTGLGRGFAGRSVAQVVHDLPLLFSVCGIAQASASVSACAQAIGLAEPAATRRARRMLVMAETLREHLLRLLHSPSRADTTNADIPDPLPIMRIVPELRAALCGEVEPFALGAVTEADAGKVEDRIVAVEALLDELVFGEAPADWLARTAPADFEGWAHEGRTVAARLVDRVLRAGWAESGAGTPAFLPELPGTSLFERLTGAEGEAFAARPDWDGKLYETTALARQCRQPLVAALLAARGSGLLTRLAARLVEVACLPGQMRDLLGEDGTAVPGGTALGGGHGLAQVEAARGRLVHGVAVEGDVVSDYRILAPTEWNFHPHGGIAKALAGLDGKDDDSLRSQAALLIEAVDPCVGYELVVR